MWAVYVHTHETLRASRESTPCLIRQLMYVCIIPFIKRAERGRHTPHNYESTPVDPLRHVGIVSSTEAHS